jgi:PAS domain S-box-containing protein
MPTAPVQELSLESTSSGRAKDRLSSRTGRPVWRVVFALLAACVLVSGAILVAVLLQLRSDAIAAGEKLVSSFAQLSAEETAGVIQNVEQVLQSTESRLVAAEASGTASEEQVRVALRTLLQGRRYLRAIWVLDAQGRSLYSSVPDTTGYDFSDQAYFTYHREHPETVFRLGAPFRSRMTEIWTIPAIRGRKAANGEFNGIIVAGMDPAYFAKIWTFQGADQDIAVALYSGDGPLLMRSPLDESMLGKTFPNSVAHRRFAAGEAMGHFQLASVVDDIPRILAFHQVGAYPALVVVGQSIAQALAAWSKIVWIGVTGWAISLAALAGLAIWLAREWQARLETVERFKLLFESNPYPALVIDYETQRVLAVNDTGIQQYGYSRAELLASSCLAIHPPEERAAFLAEWANNAPGVTRVAQGFKNILKDGTVIDVELSTRMIEFDGRTALLAIIKNVVEQQRAIRELHQSEEKYRALVNSMPVGVVETTADGHIATANTAWRRMFGFGETEDLGAVAVSTLYAEPQERNAVMAKAAVGALPELETVFRRRDGTAFPAERHFDPILDEAGRVIGLRGIVIDITRRKALETQLQQAQKMEAVGQLTGGIAHDFNNILAAILANIEALEDEEELDSRVSDRLTRIGRAVQRAAELTRQLLAFSRRQPLRPKHTDVNGLVTDVSKLLQRTLGEQIEIDSVLAADLWGVEIDRVQLEAALVNLCINARDAMLSGGRLLIETVNASLDEDYATLHPDVVAGDYAMISVTDSGSGMPAAVLAKVFEPFFTTKGIGKGTGLGLSMVYGFVRQSKGHIHIYSEVGRGTTVRIYLPRSDSTVRDAEAPGKVDLPRGGERVLVVEDDSDVRAGVVQQLRSLGYAVSEAGSGAAGVAAFEAEAEPFDLLLTDVVMPGALNGKGLSVEVLRRWPETKVVFMSGYTEVALAQDNQLGESAFLLSKPFRRTDLARMIRQVLDGAHAGAT